jgi:hypothetical protein
MVTTILEIVEKSGGLDLIKMPPLVFPGDGFLVGRKDPASFR